MVLLMAVEDGGFPGLSCGGARRIPGTLFPALSFLVIDFSLAVWQCMVWHVYCFVALLFSRGTVLFHRF